MSTYISPSMCRSRLRGYQQLVNLQYSCRLQSTISTHPVIKHGVFATEDVPMPVAKAAFPLARLKTSSIIRSLFLSVFFSHSFLFRPGFAVMKRIANSQSILLHPDKNVLLRSLLKPFIYDQFCAGTNHTEVQNTVADIKKLGFSGVILCYGKELQVGENAELLGRTDQKALGAAEIEHWKNGNIQTLSMVGQGDWLGIKFTGAGQAVTEALMRGDKADSAFIEAMDKICEVAATRGCRIWIDAEQQAVQSTIDLWTIDLMRKWNKGASKPLIYNTIQAYLKQSRNKLQHQLELSQQEGWTLAIKLVRGAYISNDARERIHDTKADTDASYEGIVRDLLQGTLTGFTQSDFPKFELFLAGHNSNTIRGATTLARELSKTGSLKVIPEFGQLQGMADDIGCELLQFGDEIKKDISKQAGDASSFSLQQQKGNFVPRVYKCLTWGTVQECMQYLVRRAVENQGAAARMKEGSAGFAKELRRRIGNAVFRRGGSVTS